MASSKNLRPYADLSIITGKYIDDNGKERNRYLKIGVLLASPHMSHMAIKLDALPLGGEGWINVFPREPGDAPKNNTDDIPF